MNLLTFVVRHWMQQVFWHLHLSDISTTHFFSMAIYPTLFLVYTLEASGNWQALIQRHSLGTWFYDDMKKVSNKG